jgi:hypothetical protein
MLTIDPYQPLLFSENDPDRDAKEQALHAMSNEDLVTLYKHTRAEAHAAREAHDMETLYPLVRGMKTIQRITSRRGLIIRARQLLES